MIGSYVPFYSEVVMDNFYGMKVPTDPSYAQKLGNAIEYLGDKYCLAIPVTKKTEVKEESREWMI